MCLNCGCMRAHDTMGKPEINITYETVKRAAEANGMTVPATLAMIARTSVKDRKDHPAEYPARPTPEQGRLDDDGGPTVGS
jgi:hypothetical protein